MSKLVNAALPSHIKAKELCRLQQILKTMSYQQFLESIPEDQRPLVPYMWELLARPSQLPPAGDWSTWLVLAGRGYGKTRAGAEWLYLQRKAGIKRMAMVAATTSELKKVMINGVAGLLAICPPHDRPQYHKSANILTWPDGAMITGMSAERPDRIRGENLQAAWADELAAWRYPESWDHLKLALREGAHTQCMITTTPRPTQIIRDLVASKRVVTISGSTYDNFNNLAANYIEDIIEKYEGTRLGRQELHAEILEDDALAMWKSSDIEATRLAFDEDREYSKIVVAVDPAVTFSKTSDETGIVVVGQHAKDSQFHVLADRSLKGTPDDWAKEVVATYRKYKANYVVAETNNGGDLVISLLQRADSRVPVKKVTASRGKHTRAELISMMYERHQVSHVGVFNELEKQMLNWDPTSRGQKDDRIDALVWGLTEISKRGSFGFNLNFPKFYK